MSPLAQSSNVLATANEQPVYSVLWHPYAIDPALTTTAALPLGAALQFNPAGMGANPGPGGDPVVGGAPYTVPYVDLMSATPVGALFAGINIGIPSLGAIAPYPPSLSPPYQSAQTGGFPPFVVCCGVSGLMQILVAAAAYTVGEPINFGTVAGQGIGGTLTYGSTYATSMQAVTLSAPGLLWAKVYQA